MNEKTHNYSYDKYQGTKFTHEDVKKSYEDNQFFKKDIKKTDNKF